MASDVRRGAVAVAVGLGLLGGVLVGGGAVAQVPPTSTSTSTTTSVPEETTTTSTTEPPLISPAPPDLLVTVGYACPVSAGAGSIPVLRLTVSITNSGGPVVVDIQVDGEVVARSVEVPTSYLGIPQSVLVALPPGEPGEPIDVELLVAGTDRHLAGAGIDHRPLCEGPPIGQVPAPARPATPRSARPAFTG